MKLHARNGNMFLYFCLVTLCRKKHDKVSWIQIFSWDLDLDADVLYGGDFKTTESDELETDRCEEELLEDGETDSTKQLQRTSLGGIGTYLLLSTFDGHWSVYDLNSGEVLAEIEDDDSIFVHQTEVFHTKIAIHKIILNVWARSYDHTWHGWDVVYSRWKWRWKNIESKFPSEYIIFWYHVSAFFITMLDIWF